MTLLCVCVFCFIMLIIIYVLHFRFWSQSSVQMINLKNERFVGNFRNSAERPAKEESSHRRHVENVSFLDSNNFQQIIFSTAAHKVAVEAAAEKHAVMRTAPVVVAKRDRSRTIEATPRGIARRTAAATSRMAENVATTMTTVVGMNPALTTTMKIEDTVRNVTLLMITATATVAIVINVVMMIATTMGEHLNTRRETVGTEDIEATITAETTRPTILTRYPWQASSMSYCIVWTLLRNKLNMKMS